MKPKVIFLIGPTAIGKTKVSVKLAQKINAEIISCDSMQIYQGMDIITSKPSQLIRRKVPHHLINIIPPTKEYNVSRYCQEAQRKIKEVLKRNKIPLFVGGTGLYMSILMDGIFKAKAEDKNIRERLYREAKQKGNEYLYIKLKKADPRAAVKIHPNDTKRIVRALEVFESTGKPISYLQKQRTGLTEKYQVTVFCLDIKRDKLYKRINERVEKMFSKGLEREVKELIRKRLSKTAAFAIGLKELKGYFDGLYGLEEAKRLMKRNTRQYAKRQLTWFRKDKRINWINIKEEEKPKDIAKNLWKELCLLP
jgi:tRNA dimethylallyltransferase